MTAGTDSIRLLAHAVEDVTSREELSGYLRLLFDGDAETVEGIMGLLPPPPRDDDGGSSSLPDTTASSSYEEDAGGADAEVVLSMAQHYSAICDDWGSVYDTDDLPIEIRDRFPDVRARPHGSQLREGDLRVVRLTPRL